MVAVLDASKLERPLLIGHWIAGEELSSLAARYPVRARGLVYLDAVGDRTVPPPRMPPVSSAQPSPEDRRNVAAFQAWQKVAQGMVFPESEIRQTITIAADGSVGGQLAPAFVPRAIFGGVKRPDYARMRIPALSIQSLPPASVAEGRASNTLIAGMFPGAADDVLNALFAVVRQVTRAQTDVFQKELAGARNVERIGASHHNFLSHSDRRAARHSGRSSSRSDGEGREKHWSHAPRGPARMNDGQENGHDAPQGSRPTATADTVVSSHILVALSEGERHGYAIMRQVAEDTGGSLQLGPGDAVRLPAAHAGGRPRRGVGLASRSAVGR